MAVPVPYILLADDDESLCTLIAKYLHRWGYEYAIVNTAEELWASIEQRLPNSILLDIKLGKDDGVQLVPLLHRRYREVPVIMVTGHASIETAVQTMRAGAFDYVKKPIDFDRLQIELSKSIEQNRLSMRVRDLESPGRPCEFHGMIGCSEEMRRVYQLIGGVGQTNVAVLVLGETGTGKELTARALHACSPRKKGPFVAVNCAAIPRDLIESVLFGHEKGSFTGAADMHIGYCEQADGGTLFLDEISEMSFELQSKLLRFLEDHIISRVGGHSGKKVDVRVVAATNRDPQDEIAAKRLREDLYYRLNVVTVLLPPLRDRVGDVPVLIQHFMEQASIAHELSMRHFTTAAMGRLERYPWPGNVRELEHFVSQLMLTQTEETIDETMLPEKFYSDNSINTTPSTYRGTSDFPTLEQMERRLLTDALTATTGSISDVAKKLAISEATVYRKIKKYGLRRQSQRGR